MSVFVHYDHNGAIHAFIAVNGPEGSGMSLAPKPGILVAEVEGVQVHPGLAAVAQLRDLAKKQVVKGPQHRVSLAKKP